MVSKRFESESFFESSSSVRDRGLSPCFLSSSPLLSEFIEIPVLSCLSQKNLKAVRLVPPFFLNQ